jgi:3-oxoacyl-[acyl-carrier-protein] synthase II
MSDTKARSIKIYAEVVGGRLSSDAYHVLHTQMEIGVVQVMKKLFKDAGLKPEDVDAINTHGINMECCL